MAANPKLKIAKVVVGDDIGLYVEDDRVFHGSGEVSEDIIDSLVEGVLDAVGQKYDVVTTTIDAEAYLEYDAHFIPESLRDLKKALRDIEKGTYRPDGDEDSDED